VRHPNLTDEVNDAIEESETAGGAHLDKLEVGKKLLVQTRNTAYLVERRKNGLYISGNKNYCPTPRKCSIPGSTFGGSMIKLDFLGRGMYMECWIEGVGTVTTSQIQEVKEIKE